MIKKRFIITGMIQVGELMRVIIIPDEIVKKKKTYNLLDISLSGDLSLMNKDAIIDSIISNNPPTLYITQDELKEEGYKIGNHIIVSLENEHA